MATENQNKKIPINELSFGAQCSFGEGGTGIDKSVKVMLIEGEVIEFPSLKALQSSSRYKEILDLVSSGGILFVEYGIRAFINKTNFNFIRPNKGQLEFAAKASKGLPLFLNHSTYDVNNEMGNVSAASSGMSSGNEVLDYRVQARESELQDKYLRGLRRSYSVSFRTKNTTCSACSSKVKLYSYGYSDFSCSHNRGDDLGGGKFVEILFDIESMREVSAVGIGGVKGANALGPSFSEKQEKEKRDMPWEKKYNEKVAELSEVNKSLSEMKSQEDARLKALEKDNSLTFKELASKYAITSLEQSGHLIGTDQKQVARFKKSVAAFGIEGAVDFYSEGSPLRQFSADAAGVSNKNDKSEDLESDAGSGGDEVKPKINYTTFSGRKVTSLADYSFPEDSKE